MPGQAVIRTTPLLALLALAIVPAGVAGCSPPSSAQKDTRSMPSSAQASQLAMAVQRLRGLSPAPLGADDQVAFGTLMFKYLPGADRLAAAIMVEDFDLWNKLGPERAEKYRWSQRALSDPAIGGMFDSAGGAWLFEEATGKTYLYTAFPLDTPPAAINAQIERMARVVPAWTTRWTAEVARIAHGRRPPPTRPVTLEDDPYAGQL